MTFNATIANYATEAYLIYYRDADTQRELAKLDNLSITHIIESDLRDLYKNGNLSDALPSLELLSHEAYEIEADYVYQHIDLISPRIAGLLIGPTGR